MHFKGLLGRESYSKPDVADICCNIAEYCLHITHNWGRCIVLFIITALTSGI